MSQPEPTFSTQPVRARPAASQGRTKPTAVKTRQPGGLGQLVASYRGRPIAARDILLYFTPGIAATLAPIGYGLWRAEYAYSRYGPVAAEHWSRPWYYLAIIAAGIFLILGWYRLSQSLISVNVTRKGITIRTGFGRMRSFTWDDINGLTSSTTQDLFFGLAVRSTYQASLILNSGKTIRLPGSLNRFPELISRIKANVYPRRLPELQSKLRTDAWLNFGPLAIQRQGLRLGRQSASWQQVKQIDVRDGRLVIEFIDRSRRTIPAHRIPNLELVLQLIDQGVPV